MLRCTKKKFSINDFFSKCDQIRRKPWIWSHLLKKTLMENFMFCAVLTLICLKSNSTSNFFQYLQKSYSFSKAAGH